MNDSLGELSDLSAIQRRKLAAVMDAAVVELPKRYRRDCCIAAARILVDVFDLLHVKARPLSVVANIFNEALIDRFEAEGDWPATYEQGEQWARESGAWAIILGPTDATAEAGRWPGHAVVIAWENVLIDLTLSQANRPPKGIALGPLVASVRPEDLDGVNRHVVEMNGCQIHYLARPDDRSFMVGRDWQDRQRCAPIVREIVRSVRQQLREG